MRSFLFAKGVIANSSNSSQFPLPQPLEDSQLWANCLPSFQQIMILPQALPTLTARRQSRLSRDKNNWTRCYSETLQPLTANEGALLGTFQGSVDSDLFGSKLSTLSSCSMLCWIVASS
jgi:hypothetical protein